MCVCVVVVSSCLAALNHREQLTLSHRQDKHLRMSVRVREKVWVQD